MNSSQANKYQISIIIPFLNERESLPKLFEWIKESCKGFSYEVIGIDDGSTDDSWQVLEEFHEKHPEQFKGVQFRGNLGKATALNTGFRKAKGDVIITMDADLQDSPDEVPELYRMIQEDEFDLVSGWKQKRHDPLSKTIPSKFFNRVTRIVSGIQLNDFNCGLKAYRNKVVKSIHLQGDMHRYIPVIAKQAGFKKIGEKVVEHRAREFGSSKYGMERLLKGFLDLLTVTFISRFGKRPMHFFGLWGVLSFLFGFLSVFILAAQKLIQLKQKIYGQLITDSVWFYIALTLMIIGVQLFLAGYLGELISRQKETDESRLIDQELG